MSKFVSAMQMRCQIGQQCAAISVTGTVMMAFADQTGFWDLERSLQRRLWKRSTYVRRKGKEMFWNLPAAADSYGRIRILSPRGSYFSVHTKARLHGQNLFNKAG